MTTQDARPILPYGGRTQDEMTSEDWTEAIRRSRGFVEVPQGLNADEFDKWLEEQLEASRARRAQGLPY